MKRAFHQVLLAVLLLSGEAGGTPGLSDGEIFDIMGDTFAKKDTSKSVSQILAEQDQQEEQKAEKVPDKKEEENLEEMSLTEHLEFAKKQAEQAEKERVQKEKEDAKRKAEEDKKKKEKAKKDAIIKAQKEKERKIQAMKDAADLGFDPEDFADGDLDLGQNAADSKAEVNQNSQKIDQVLSEEKEKSDSPSEEKKEEPKPPSKTADDALESAGAKLAKRQYKKNVKRSKQQLAKKAAKIVKKEKAQPKEAEPEPEQKQAAVETPPPEPEESKAATPEPEALKVEETTLQTSKEVNTGKVDIQALIASAVKHQGGTQSSPAISMPAPKQSLVQVKAPPAPKKSPALNLVVEPEPQPAKPSLTTAQQAKISAQLKEEQKKQGERAPSEIAQALADVSMPSTEENPQGFVGKYLKKHRDMKLKAQEAVLQQEKEEQEIKEKALKAQKEQEEAAKAAETAALFQPVPSPNAPKRKLTLSERAEKKLKDEEAKKQEQLAQEAAVAAVQATPQSELAQLDEFQMGAILSRHNLA